MRDLKFACPHCEQHIQCEETVAGQRIPCPACGREVDVPDLPDEHHLRITTGRVPVPTHAHGAPRATDMAAFRNEPPPRPHYSRLAIVSLSLSCASVLLGPLASIPGIVCGYLARAEIKRDGRILGDDLAKAGIIVGYLFLTLFALIIARWFVLHNDPHP
jgi:hypothetical protein